MIDLGQNLLTLARSGDLVSLTAALIDVPSESFAEAPITDAIEMVLRSNLNLDVTRIGDNLVARTQMGRDRRLILAGHTDTVPADNNQTARLEGDTLWGLGSTDMKGGLAVMLGLATSPLDASMDVTYVFYAREEVAAVHSGLGELFDTAPELLEGDLAILGEPTDGDIEAGCQGTIRVEVVLAGSRAHTARAWMGRNAIHRLAGILGGIDSYVPRRPIILGCEFHEALQVVKVTGGVSGNVVPDSASIDIAHRFAPDRTLAEAEAHLRDFLAQWIEPGDSLRVVDSAPAAYPAVEDPSVASLIQKHGLEVRAKLGWTDVARFSAVGIPAVNLGPGIAAIAHTAEERVERHSLEKTFHVLDDLLFGGE
ncbi:MAG: succinyl-diaminopimelate desuccinylase [Microthrixaceae bacterium]